VNRVLTFARRSNFGAACFSGLVVWLFGGLVTWVSGSHRDYQTTKPPSPPMHETKDTARPLIPPADPNTPPLCNHSFQTVPSVF
jgi:hypothetical protein